MRIYNTQANRYNDGVINRKASTKQMRGVINPEEITSRKKKLNFKAS